MSVVPYTDIITLSPKEKYIAMAKYAHNIHQDISIHSLSIIAGRLGINYTSLSKWKLYTAPLLTYIKE